MSCMQRHTLRIGKRNGFGAVKQLFCDFMKTAFTFFTELFLVPVRNYNFYVTALNKFHN
jgi:hypothetical protein